MTWPARNERHVLFGCCGAKSCMARTYSEGTSVGLFPPLESVWFGELEARFDFAEDAASDWIVAVDAILCRAREGLDVEEDAEAEDALRSLPTDLAERRGEDADKLVPCELTGEEGPATPLTDVSMRRRVGAMLGRRGDGKDSGRRRWRNDDVNAGDVCTGKRG